MTNTPETDAFLKEYYPEHPEAAWVRTQLDVTFEGPLEQILKRLERERNEARKEAEYYKARYDVLRESW